MSSRLIRTEATETALKLIKTYGKTLDKKKTGIICISGNWHGRTVGSQMLSGKNKQSEWIGYFDKSIHHIDFPYPWSLKTTKKKAKNFFKKSIKKKFGNKYNFRKNISAILLETFQGWGAIFYPKDYVKEIEKFCKKITFCSVLMKCSRAFAEQEKILVLNTTMLALI